MENGGELHLVCGNKLKDFERTLLAKEFETNAHLENDLELQFQDKIELKSQDKKKADFISEII